MGPRSGASMSWQEKWGELVREVGRVRKSWGELTNSMGELVVEVVRVGKISGRVGWDELVMGRVGRVGQLVLGRIDCIPFWFQK